MTLIEVFDHLSSVLQYFVPGYCSLWIFSWCRSKKEKSESITFILSCVISYVLLTIVEFANDTFIHAELSTLVKSFWTCFSGIVLAVILGAICNAKWFSNVTVFLFHKTPNDRIWRDILNLKYGSNIKIYEKDKEGYVLGHYRNLEENVEDPWLAVSAYGKFIESGKLDQKDELIEKHLDNKDAIYTVRFSSIDHIEVQ